MFSQKYNGFFRAFIILFSILLILNSDFFDARIAAARDLHNISNIGAISKQETGNQSFGFSLDAFEGKQNSAPSDVSFAQMSKLFAHDGKNNDGFGFAVAIDGDTAVVSANGVDVEPTGFDRGAVYVYTRRGFNWAFQQKLFASDGGNFESFGLRVDIEGNTIIVSTYLDNIGSNEKQGSVYVFEKVNSVWTERQKLVASDGRAGNWFGSSISLSGNTLIVGALYGDGAISNQGSAYIFIKENDVWKVQAKLSASDGQALDYFGVSVAIDGNYAIVGASQAKNGTSFRHGAAYVFVRDGTNWTQQQKFTAENAYEGDSEEFGLSVDINGNTAAVGANNQTFGRNGQQGAAYIFVRKGLSWSKQATFSASDGDRYDFFGRSLDLDGDQLLVGAPGHSTNVSGSFNKEGAAYIFKRQGENWTQQAEFFAPDGKTAGSFGNALAIQGNVVMIGLPNDSNGTSNALGSVYTFINTANLPDLQPSDDSGISDSDNITNKQNLTFNLNGLTAGATVELLRDNVTVASGTVGGDNIQLTDSNTPPNGDFHYSIRQTLAGNVISQSAATVVTVDTVSPTAAINQATSQIDPSNTLPVNFKAAFSEPVFGFDQSDVSLAGSTANVSSAAVSTSGNGANYNIAVSGFISNGQTVQASLLPNAARDDAGNLSLNLASTDNAVTVDNVAPTAVVTQAAGQNDPTFGQPIIFNVVFSEPVTGFQASDISLSGSTANISSAQKVISGSGTTYNIAVSNILSSGLVRVSIVSGAVQDALGNSSSSISYADNTVTFLIRRFLFDYDGDSKDDITVFRPSNGTWYSSRSRQGFSAIQFGASGDVLVPADYDGDGKIDYAVYRAGTWYLQRSAAGFAGIQFGLASDIPIPADFDGDGNFDLAVYRPSNGTWYVLNLANNAFNAVQFGISTDKPVVADYDGDGKADYAVYRPDNGVWYLLQSTKGFAAVQFGISTDKPVVGDYDGDGKADEAVYRPSIGTWYLFNSTSGFASVQFGIAEDKPTPADYDGDGKTDISVFRPSNGTWYQLRSTSGFFAQQFGVSEDLPAPNAFVR